MKCACPIEEGMNFDQLKQIISDNKMCTGNFWICSNLDKHLRHADVERSRRAYYNKKLKREGYTDEQISKMPSKRRVRHMKKKRLKFDD